MFDIFHLHERNHSIFGALNIFDRNLRNVIDPTDIFICSLSGKFISCGATPIVPGVFSVLKISGAVDYRIVTALKTPTVTTG